MYRKMLIVDYHRIAELYTPDVKYDACLGYSNSPASPPSHTTQF
jgi:hypothetical protein